MFFKGIGALILGLYIGLNAEYSEIKPVEERNYCTIKGEDSQVLYKNEYENDVLNYENIIFLNEESKKYMTSSYDPLTADEILYTGLFSGEFINVEYNKSTFSYEMALAYMSDAKFYGCTTNKIISRGFDKNGKEIGVPKYEDRIKKAHEKTKFYSILDITTRNGKDYIVGIYAESFSDLNPNFLTITAVFKKENFPIDVSDEKQAEKFWNQYADYQIEMVETDTKMLYEAIDIRGRTYYMRVTNDTWNGDYHQDEYYTDVRGSNSIQKVVSYEEYLECLETISSYAEEKIEPYYKDKNSNYIILSYSNGSSWCDLELIDCVEENNQIVIYGVEDVYGVMASGSGFLAVIPTKMPVGTNVIFRNCYSKYEISNLINYGSKQTEISIDKPIIYLYPTTETKVNVKLMNPERLTCVYPEYDYENGWNVIAKLDGDLIDINTGRSLYSLYYESEATYKYEVEKDGFIVKGEDVAVFLEQKLAILGLTEREANEFIIYWLPILQENKYNYIRFATEDEIKQNMPLKIEPNPDTVIRVLMTYKGLEESIEVKEQKLIIPERNGFVAVEWGGTEIK